MNPPPMPTLLAVYGERSVQIEVPAGTLLGEAIAGTELPLEQPCAGRGTCGLCKVLVESGNTPPDQIEQENLSPGELALGTRLACRALIQGDMQVALAPIVVYSDKIFRASTRYRRGGIPLGVAIDLGSTTVAAFLTTLDDGNVAAGGASLNQQAVYGADIISRLEAARSEADAKRLHRLSLASINQALGSLNLSPGVRRRIRKVVIVGNVAMHHFLVGYPTEGLAALPFQPFMRGPIHDARPYLGGIFPPETAVLLPPLIGGFIGSDALACLAYFAFDQASGPMAAIDLGTNGEVMVTDGRRILAASTAAGPAFEGVNISCGSRAVDGAVVRAEITSGELQFETLGGEPPVGLTGSGLLSLVRVLRRLEVLAPDGRLLARPAVLGDRLEKEPGGVRRLRLQADPELSLTQLDVRELQKAKGAIRAAIEVLLGQLRLSPGDLERVVLTGSFGGQVEPQAALELGLIPPVDPAVIETTPNGAGLGAALFLSEEGLERGVRLAQVCEQVELDQDPAFLEHFIAGLALHPGGSG